jgi:hypothetical protein
VQVHDFRAGLRAWIDARGHELIAPLGDDSVDTQLDHQRRVQRMLFDDDWMRWGWPKQLGRRAQLVSAGTIPRLVEL